MIGAIFSLNSTQISCQSVDISPLSATTPGIRVRRGSNCFVARFFPLFGAAVLRCRQRLGSVTTE